MLSGVIQMFKLLSDEDKNYIKSSLDEQARENLQNLFDQYNKFYRFRGII